jgi:hypothetical protein
VPGRNGIPFQLWPATSPLIAKGNPIGLHYQLSQEVSIRTSSMQLLCEQGAELQADVVAQSARQSCADILDTGIDEGLCVHSFLLAGCCKTTAESACWVAPRSESSRPGIYAAVPALRAPYSWTLRYVFITPPSSKRSMVATSGL